MSTAESSVSPPKLELRNVSRSFQPPHGGRELPVLSPTSLKVTEGEFICLVGPSGCGKTTLLNLVSGLVSPSHGTVLIDGKPVQGPGSDRMVMFQESALFPWRDAIGNVLFGLEFQKHLSRAQRLERAREYLALVGLAGFEHYPIHKLSGGMRQRVALARALAPNPNVLLMDEPFAALDAMTREQLYSDIQRICSSGPQSARKTVLFVTHNAREAACLADRVIVLAASPGRVTDIIPVSLPRMRDINDSAVSAVARQISAALRNSEKLTPVGERTQEDVWSEPQAINS